MVLNSLSGELFEGSLRCLAKGGTFLELGEADLLSLSSDSSKFLKNTSFHGILLDDLFGAKEEMKKSIHTLLATGKLHVTLLINSYRMFIRY